MLIRIVPTTLLLAAAALVALAGQPPQGANKPQGKKPPGKEAEPKPLVVNDQLTNADPFDKKRANCHHKVHTYKMIPGRTYTIRMHSNQLDSYLRLEDSAGTELAFDDDSDGFPNAKIVFTATKADNYRIIATTFGAGMKGAYTLSVRPSGVRKIVLNAAGQVTNTDPFDVVRQSARHKLHNYKMTAGKNYIVQLNSNQFAPCVRLEDALGNQIKEGQFNGGSSTLEFMATKTDNFRIIVTSLNFNQFGAYTLTVMEE